MGEVLSAIEAAIGSGRSAMDAAIQAWERINHGKRDGLGDILLELADQGKIQAVIVVDRGARSRKVAKIIAVPKAGRFIDNASAEGERAAVTEIERKRTIFVVHGRDTPLRDAMFQFLRSINLRPLEWSELTATSGSGTPYIGQVLELAFERAQAVVVMMTPDEDVRLSERLGGGEAGVQARPNVIFEAGLALARNPQRTVIVEVGTLRLFSDIAGRHVVRLDDDSPDAIGRRQDLAHRLEQAGCAVSLRGTDWHRSGQFKVGRS